MKPEYDFTKGERARFAEPMRKDGYRVTVHRADGSVRERYFPPGVAPSTVPAVHVYPTRSGWAVRTESVSRATRIAKSQAEALQIGLDLATRRGCELVFHPQRLLLATRR